MKQKIIDILLKHSEELNIKGSLMKEPEKEDWLWSGSYDKVAQEIVKLFAIPDVSGCYTTAYNVANRMILNKGDKLLQDILLKLNDEEFGTLRDRLADAYMNNR